MFRETLKVLLPILHPNLSAQQRTAQFLKLFQKLGKMSSTEASNAGDSINYPLAMFWFVQWEAHRIEASVNPSMRFWKFGRSG